MSALGALPSVGTARHRGRLAWDDPPLIDRPVLPFGSFNILTRRSKLRRVSRFSGASPRQAGSTPPEAPISAVARVLRNSARAHRRRRPREASDSGSLTCHRLRPPKGPSTPARRPRRRPSPERAFVRHDPVPRHRCRATRAVGHPPARRTRWPRSGSASRLAPIVLPRWASPSCEPV